MQFSIYLSFSKESGRAEWCSGRCPARVLIGPGGGQSGLWRSVGVVAVSQCVCVACPGPHLEPV